MFCVSEFEFDYKHACMRLYIICQYLRLLDPNYLNQYDEYKRCYAELLYRWGLLNKRIEVLKYMSKPPPEHIGLGKY